MFQGPCKTEICTHVLYIYVKPVNCDNTIISIKFEMMSLTEVKFNWFSSRSQDTSPIGNMFPPINKKMDCT